MAEPRDWMANFLRVRQKLRPTTLSLVICASKLNVLESLASPRSPSEVADATSLTADQAEVVCLALYAPSILERTGDVFRVAAAYDLSRYPTALDQLLEG